MKVTKQKEAELEKLRELRKQQELKEIHSLFTKIESVLETGLAKSKDEYQTLYFQCLIFGTWINYLTFFFRYPNSYVGVGVLIGE